MPVDFATVRRVARLALSEEEANRMIGELNVIVHFMAELSELTSRASRASRQ